MPGAKKPQPSAGALLERTAVAAVAAGGPSAPTPSSIFRKFALCILYIVVSAALIRFNKFLMADERFPHALALSAGHTAISSFLGFASYMVFPSMFPAMQEMKGRRSDLLRWFVPIAMLFGANLIGSNEAYIYCSVTFLQFMKESNAAIVFVISCIVGTQLCTRLRVFVIFWVVVSASVSVCGELHFVWLGFFLQATAQIAECTRSVLGEVLLRGKKLDPLTYNLFLSPVCFFMLALLGFLYWETGTWADLRRCWPLLLANGSLAFCLSLLVASVIKECSAVGLALCGVAKDVILIALSSTAFGEEVSERQAVAFVFTLAGLMFWSFMKTHPDSLVVYMFERMLCAKRMDEKLPLLPPAAPSAEKNV